MKLMRSAGRIALADREASVVPLINVVFLLLLYFMTAGRLTDTARVRIDAPSALADEIMTREVALLTLTADGTFAMGAGDINEAELLAQLKALVGSGDHRVRLLADADASADALEKVIDLCQSAGVSQVRLVTQRR